MGSGAVTKAPHPSLGIHLNRWLDLLLVKAIKSEKTQSRNRKLMKAWRTFLSTPSRGSQTICNNVDETAWGCGQTMLGSLESWMFSNPLEVGMVLTDVLRWSLKCMERTRGKVKLQIAICDWRDNYVVCCLYVNTKLELMLCYVSTGLCCLCPFHRA